MNITSGKTADITPYTLVYPAWIWNSGMAKGIYHDRQSLGVILPAGASLSIRCSNSIESTLTLNLLNDDRHTESQINITGEWSTFTATHACVPFIETPYSPILAKIEFITTGEKQLPVYTPTSDAQAFLDNWEHWGAEFALIITTYAALLVPAGDKSKIVELHQGSGLNQLESYYTSIFEFYNALAGISFDATIPTDKNIANRYFMKADLHGSGSAYYGHAWTAETNNTIRNFWLDPRPENWGCLHEIAHGYQGAFMYNSTVHTGEVWNNLYATYYQHKMLGDCVYELGWMYGGNAQGTFTALQKLFDSGSPISTWQLHEILFFYMFIFDKATEQAFTVFNQTYRQLSNKAGFNLADHPMMDLLATVCAQTKNLDISFFMKLAGTNLSDALTDANLYSNLESAGPLYRLVDASQLDAIQKTLGLKTPLSLVDTKALKITGLKGSLTISMSPQAFSENRNKVLILKNGSNISLLVKITNSEIQVNDLPIGPYKLHNPSAPHAKREAATHDAEVRAQMNNSIALNYNYSFGSSLASQHIFLSGLGGKEFAWFTVDMKSARATLKVIDCNPHSYFDEKIYAAVTVRDINGFIVLHKGMPGINTTGLHEEFSIGFGHTIHIFHNEPSRIGTPQQEISFIDPHTKDNILKVTQQGLVNGSLTILPGENLKDKIEKAACTLRQAPHLLLHLDLPQKDDILTAIVTFSYPEQSLLLEKYRDLWPSYADTGGPIVFGHYFTWKLSGLGNHTMMNIAIDTRMQTITIETMGRTPHLYFKSIYIAVWVRTHTGEPIHCEELRGDIPSQANFVTLPFQKDYTVSICHLEPSRSELVNADTQEKYSIDQIHVLRATGEEALQI